MNCKIKRNKIITIGIIISWFKGFTYIIYIVGLLANVIRNNLIPIFRLNNIHCEFSTFTHKFKYWKTSFKSGFYNHQIWYSKVNKYVFKD